MDHAINALRTFMEVSFDCLYEEWKSGDYKYLSACPSYKEATTYLKAMSVLKKHWYGSDFKEDTLENTLEAYIWTSKNENIKW